MVHYWEPADWEALKRRATELGQDKVIAYIVFLLKILFDYQLPWEARRVLAIKRLNAWERSLLKQRIKRDSLPVWSPFVLMSSGSGMKKRVFFFFENLFPGPEALRQVFPEIPHCGICQLYWKRFLQILTAMKTA
jgi:hypothetical protein